MEKKFDDETKWWAFEQSNHSIVAQNGRNWESADRLPKSTRKAIILGKVFSQNRKMAA